VNAKRTVPAREISDRTTLPFMSVQIQSGDKLAIDGHRGLVEFLGFTRHDNGNEWVDVMTARGKMRTVRPSAIREVHLARRPA
jgi:hypothetical protein